MMSAWTIQGPNLDARQVVRRRMDGERMPLYIYGHQGMGDHILCSGLYRWLSDYWQINVGVILQRQQNVSLMLSDIPDVTLMRFATETALARWLDALPDSVVLRLGFAAKDDFDRWKFDREFYSQANIPFEERWLRYRSPECPQVEALTGDYVFVHDNPDMGSRIKIPGVRPIPNRGIFEHRSLILGASELHCASSSFAVFADSHDLSGKGLFFYPFGREIPAHKNSWKIMN